MKKNWFTKKLNSRVGESLPEVLIAVLVVALGMLMLSTLLNVSSRMVDKSQSKVKAVYEDVCHMDTGNIDGSSGTVIIQYVPINSNGIKTTESVNVDFHKGQNLISYDSEGLKQ